MAMAGSLDDRYFASSMDILTMNAKALYKSRAIAAICARISALCLLYTIGLSIIFTRDLQVKSSFMILFTRSEAERYCWIILNSLVPRGISLTSLGLSLMYVCLENPFKFFIYCIPYKALPYYTYFIFHLFLFLKLIRNY